MPFHTHTMTNNPRTQDKILREIEAEEAWERTVQAQPKEVRDKIYANRKLQEEKRHETTNKQ